MRTSLSRVTVSSPPAHLTSAPSSSPLSVARSAILCNSTWRNGVWAALTPSVGLWQTDWGRNNKQAIIRRMEAISSEAAGKELYIAASTQLCLEQTDSFLF